MRVELDGGGTIDLGDVETGATIGITDYSKRVTDDFGVTTVLKRGFARTMSVKLGLAFDDVDALEQRLAGLRATPARWVADDRFASLAFRGFYKDFSIDLAVPPQSYCTLTVEGLAETDDVADDGSDPAPAGAPSTLSLLQPVTVIDAMLVASSVDQTDYPEWAAATAYPTGARVIRGTTHRIWESVTDGNAGNDPANGSAQWLDVGPTNRWAMFDQALGTATTWGNTIVVTIAPGAVVDAVALLDVKGAFVRVQADGYDRTITTGAGAITFLDVPPTTGNVTVSIDGGGANPEVGTLLIGKLVTLGLTEASPTAGITDYSRKVVDDFGAVTVVQRAWAKRMTANALIRTEAVDIVANRIAAVRALPSLWIGGEGVDCLTVYGFFKDFSITVDQEASKLSLSIEGLSQAAKIAPFTVSTDWPDVGDPDGTKPEDNATVGAPAGTTVAGVPAEKITLDIDSLVTRATDLEAEYAALLNTYGDTATAEQSANAADASRQAADLAAQNATERASAADGSAAAASGSASLASTKADAAGQSAQAASAAVQTAQGWSQTASTYADAANSSSVSAGASAAAAQTSASLSASIGPGVLNSNPSFAAYASANGAPDGWSPWVFDGGTPTRVAGLNAVPWSVHFDAAAGQKDGIVQGVVAQAGAFVIQVTADLTSGTWDGAGVTLQWGNLTGSTFTSAGIAKLSFLTDEDSAGYVGNNGARRTWSLYVDTGVNGSINYLYLYALANWDGFAAALSAKGVTFRDVRVRPATAAEIAGQRADANATLALAQITHQETVSADADNALSDRIDSVVSSVGNANAAITSEASTRANAVSALSDRVDTVTAAVGDTSARLDSEVTTRASADTALGQRVDTLGTTVGQNTAGISLLATAVSNNYASAAQAVTTLQAFATAAPNLIADVGAWTRTNGQIGYAASSTWGPYLLGYPTGATGYQQQAAAPRVGCDGSTAYTVSCDLLCLPNGGSAAQLCYAQVRQYDASGAYISDLCHTSNAQNVNFADTADRKRFWATGTTDPAARSLEVELWAYNDGSNTPLVGLRRAKLERGSTPTAYTTEGQTTSISSSLQVLEQTTDDLAGRISTAVFQVLAQAGTSRALFRLLADGYDASEIDLVAASIHLFAQSSSDPTQAIEALSVDSTGRVTIPHLAVAEIELENLDRSGMTASGSASVSGTTSSPTSGGTTYVSNLEVDLAIGSAGIVWVSVNAAQSFSTNSGDTSGWNSCDILDANNNVLASAIVPFGPGGSAANGRISGVYLPFANSWGARTIKVRLACHGSASTYTSLVSPAIVAGWSAI